MAKEIRQQQQPGPAEGRTLAILRGEGGVPLGAVVEAVPAGTVHVVFYDPHTGEPRFAWHASTAQLEALGRMATGAATLVPTSNPRRGGVA